MQVLVFLAQHSGEVVTRAQLEAAVWSGRVVTEDALTNAITKLRRAFGDSARQSKVIETIPKTGYRLIPQALTASAPHDQPRQRVAWWRGKVLAYGAILLVSVLSVVGAFIWYGNDRAAKQSGPPRVAVLPFVNLGSRPEQAFFANGITRDLITDLSKLAGLEVIAPGSIFAADSAEGSAGQVGRSLAADYVVRGSVQRSRQRVRINAQLINVGDERALWADRFDTLLDDVFQVQDRVARGVVSALQLELNPGESLRGADGATNSIAAYDALLQGLEAYGRRSPDGNQLARQHFERALDLDPGYARGLAALALVYAREAIDGWTPQPAQSLQRAQRFAQAAVERDPSMPQGYFVLGQVALFQRRHGDAITAVQQALRFNPNYADAHALHAWILNYAGRSDQALGALAKARRLNPITPLSYREILGEIHYTLGRHDEAIAELSEVVQDNPTHLRARMWLAVGLARSGRMEQARWEVEELKVSRSDDSAGELALAFPFKDARIRDGLLLWLQRAGWED